MIFLRAALLSVASLAVLVGFGALAPDSQPAALQVLVAAVVAVLAPLFWPGGADTPLRTGGRMLAWSLVATGVAALGMVLLGRSIHSWARLLPLLAMLLPILLLTHGLAAGLQAGWQGHTGAEAKDPSPRWAAGLTASLVLVLLGTAPLWLGPAAEAVSTNRDTALDALVAASPLTHLGVAAGLDLLRTAWLYQNANLAALPVNYPEPGHLGAVYATSCTLFILALVVLQRRQGAAPPTPLTEKTQ